MAHEQRCDFLQSAIWQTISLPKRVYIANVGMPKLGDAVARYALKNWGVSAQFLLSSETACGVKNAYDRPAQLGIDRWLSLIGVWREYVRPAFIVDVGSAVTIDVLGVNGMHQGGWIYPGPTKMLDVLLTQTEQINRYAHTCKNFWGKNTEQAVYNGVYFTVCASIHHLRQESQKRLGYELLPIITGGGAQMCLPFLDADYVLEVGLVLAGMGFWVSDEMSDTGVVIT